MTADIPGPVVDPGSFAKAADFLGKLGIAVKVQPGAKGFLPGMMILRGVILVDSADDRWTGNLLHEAGHLATMPKRFWPLASGGLKRAGEAMGRYVEEHPKGAAWPEDPVLRACLQCDDAEATAWSYAAAHACGIDTRTPFYGYYDGAGHDVHFALTLGAYNGIHGLQAAGMTSVRGLRGEAKFPEMIRWMAPE